MNGKIKLDGLRGERMKIAIDIDNVLTNTTECVIDYINERLNIGLKMEDLTSYWIENNIDPQFAWIAPLAFSDSAMWKHVVMMPRAVAGVKWLYEQGHEVYFATATTAENFRKKVGFLTREFSFLPEGYVRQHAISIKHKQLLDVDVLIDDCLDNLVGKRRYISIVFDYPWNRDMSKYPQVSLCEWNALRRVSDWINIPWEIQKIDTEKKCEKEAEEALKRWKKTKNVEYKRNKVKVRIKRTVSWL